MKQINLQSRGPIWQGKQSAPQALFFSPTDRLPNSANTCLAECVLNDWDTSNPLINREAMLANARLLTAGFNAFDKAGRTLNVDASELAESVDVAGLIQALESIAHDAQTDIMGLGRSEALALVADLGQRARAQLSKLPKGNT